MPDFTVARIGTDTSGRPIYATRYMADWWRRVCDDLGFTPTIVQGAFMVRAGGGASASAGYHDQGGCFDLRTWDRTGSQVDAIVRTCRRLGAAAWVRDQRHGMDPHIHLLLGTDQPLASGARTQWQQYLNGRDGLAGNGPDYHWRPNPLVTTPPEDDMFENEDRALLKKAAADAEAARKAIEGLDLAKLRELVRGVRTKVKGGRGEVRQLQRDVDEIAAALGIED